MNCHREIELLEYLLGNSEYDSVIAEEGVHYNGQEQKDIIRADDVEGRLTNSLERTLENSFENSLKRLNQHTDVLIEEEKSEQHTKVFPEEEEALRPYYVFFFFKPFIKDVRMIHSMIISPLCAISKSLSSHTSLIFLKKSSFHKVL